MRIFSPLAVLLAASTAASANPVSPNQMLFHAGRGQMVMLAADDQSGFEELWGWNGKQWVLIPCSGPKPPARELSGAVYDSRRKRIVLYGGAAVKPRHGSLGDLWEWDGARWHEIKVNGPAPGPRDHHAMAYDEERGRAVLFSGGRNGETRYSDTWEWDGSTWTKAAATEVPGGGGAHNTMVYDSVRKRVILFAGMEHSGRSHSETWSWDGKIWTRLAVEAEIAPPRRYRHRAGFNDSSGDLVVFGGLLPKRAPAEIGDTWTFNGTRWSEMKPDGPAPEARHSHVMSYDPQRRRIMLYGGFAFDGKTGTRYQDTWEWDGKSWSRLN